ncbi:MAG: hypothetical protein WCS65_05205 [Verrucomicrobiae bacterium]
MALISVVQNMVSLPASQGGCNSFRRRYERDEYLAHVRRQEVDYVVGYVAREASFCSLLKVEFRVFRPSKNPLDHLPILGEDPRMFRWLLLFVASAAAASAADPAFSGIPALKPYGSSARVVEIRGERGEPQPKEWIFLLSDPKARGGVREVTVAAGEITSERTPLRGLASISGLSPIDTSRLAFDSNKVFRTVQGEATKKEIGFHWIGYTLRADAQSKVPVWEVKIYDSLGASAGTIRISAADGSVVSPLRATQSAPAEPAPQEKALGGIVGDVSKAAGRAVRSTTDSTLRLIGTIQEELVGERTIGPKEED